MDFFKIEAKYVKSTNTIYVYPNFIVKDSKDLIIKGGNYMNMLKVLRIDLTIQRSYKFSRWNYIILKFGLLLENI